MVLLALSLIPPMRADCGEEFEFVGIPLSVKVIVVVVWLLSLIPLVRGYCYLAKCPSL